MSTTVDFSTVTNSIAALSVSGVTIRDIDEVTDSNILGGKILFPQPVDFITDINLIRDEITGQWNTLTYTLHYVYLHCPTAGGLGGLKASYSGLITNAAAILLAFSSDATLSGAMDNGSPRMEGLGIVTDPAGNAYYGCLFVLAITQFLEV
jgi:hypothetical protein